MKSQIKYRLRRPTILGGKRFHPKSPLATKRYQSYGNRFLRSRKLAVRLGGSGGVQLCGPIAGACTELTNYGSPGTIKQLTFQFSGKDPVTVLTLTDSIYYDIGVGDIYEQSAISCYLGGTIRYWVRRFTQYSGGHKFNFTGVPVSNPVPPPSARYSVDYDTQLPCTSDGFAIDFSPSGFVDFLDVTPVTFASTFYYRVGLGSSTSFGFAAEIQNTASNPTQIDPEGLINSFTSESEFIFEYYGASIGQAVYINVFDAGGNLLRSARGQLNVLTDYPTVNIVEGDTGDGFSVQSAKYPQVWYSVPINYSSCNCGDFLQYTPAPNIPLRDYRDWRGSNAGSFNPCKHIMAVKRVMAIAQNFNDYISYSNFPYIPELAEMNYEVNSLGRVKKIKEKRWGSLSRFKAFLNAPLFYDAAEEGRRMSKPYQHFPRSGHHV